MKTEKKTRLSQEEVYDLKRLAERWGISESAILRQAFNEYRKQFKED